MHYERIHRRIEQYFKDVDVTNITRANYQCFLNEMTDILSQDQIGRVHAFCTKLVENMIYDGLLIKNFTFGASVVSNKPPLKKETDKFLDVEEIKRIKQYYKDRTHHFSASTHIILLMIETGGRFSDCINLKRKDINQVKNEIFLNGIKNRSAPRTVKVSKEIINILLKYADNHPTSLDGYLFTHNGKRITNSTVNKSIRTACNYLNINKNVTSHAFRHTHASYLIYKNINIYNISKRLGHSDISVTLKDYGHLLKESQERDEKRTVELMSCL